MCANDQMAIGVLRTLTAAGVRVPDEVAVTGFDDLYPARLADPPLTTVRQPMCTLGDRACARLLDRIAHPSLTPTVQLLPTELVLRSSCGLPARYGNPPARQDPQARLSALERSWINPQPSGPPTHDRSHVFALIVCRP